MNVSSVKNLNGETFSAVQDADLTTVVQTNSGNWQDITAYQTTSSTYLTALPNTASINVLSANDRVRVGNDSSYKSYAHIDRNGLYFKDGNTRPYNIGIDSTGSNFYISTAQNGYARIYASSISDWNDAMSSYQNASGTYLTAVDLTPYQTIEGMTAYQPAGSYATTNELEQVSGDITALIPSTAGLASESYVQTNSAVLTGMIDGKQDTLTFGYDEQDRINSINNSALAGGGDVPEDVMVETNLEYNAVNEISGYNGSAIAQYGAEKQWLVHDDTIVHVANSAQYALGVNVSAVAQLLGVDETVLWESDSPSTFYSISPIQLSENISAFERIRIIENPWPDNPVKYVHEFAPNNNIYLSISDAWVGGTNDYTSPWTMVNSMTFSAGDKCQYLGDCKAKLSQSVSGPDRSMRIYKIVGIGRKS